MSVKPILFNTGMVRAILDGRKTVTRRVIKEKLPKDPQWGYTVFTPKGKISCRGIFAVGYGEGFYKLPYQPDDILYVRETWREYNGKFYYKADECFYYDDYFTRKLPSAPKWHPSIHMPKEAARIWLKVTDVRAERLQDITDKQAEKEGCSDYTSTALGFCYIWDSTIKKKDLHLYGWEANPWVWAIEFERTVKPDEN